MKYQKNWLDKLITHNRDTVGDFGSRVVLHIPIGVLIGYLCFNDPWAGIGLLLMFLIYEWTEDWRVKDHAWKDLFGSLVGFVCIALIEMLIGVLG